MILIVRLLHILAGIWFVGGILGRWISYAQVRRAADIGSAGALLALSDRFERLMVIPGSLLALALGLFTAWLQGRPFIGMARGGGWLLGSLILFVGLTPVVMFLLVPRRKRRLGALASALAQSSLTPELRAALDDRVVIRSRVGEMLVVALILVLMIVKPF